MRSFLVPVDFSPASRNALSYAAQLSKLMDAELVLLHVYMLPTPVSEAPYVMVTADEVEKEQEDLLQKEIDFASELTGKKTTGFLRLGIPSDEISAFAREKGMTMIIMGMKGLGGLEQLMGSTTTNVIRKLDLPVLVIPEIATFRAIQKVLYPSDFAYNASHHLYDSLIDLLHYFKAQLSVLHISHNHTGETAEKLVQKKNIEQVFREVTHDFRDWESRSVNQGITEYLDENPADLLVMVAHHHGFLERFFTKSHTAAIVYETSIPLLVLQDKG